MQPKDWTLPQRVIELLKENGVIMSFDLAEQILIFMNSALNGTPDELEEAKNLYEHWPNLPFEEKRSIVEIITNHITIGKGDITLNLSYIPSYLFFS